LDFRFAEYEIDIGRHELRRAGEVVAIEPQVFDLLVYLVRHRDRIISKDELIDAVWQGRIVSDAALSSCISAARRAIGDNGDDQLLIRTLHKRGFRLSAVSMTTSRRPHPQMTRDLRGRLPPPGIRGNARAMPKPRGCNWHFPISLRSPSCRFRT